MEPEFSILHDDKSFVCEISGYNRKRFCLMLQEEERRYFEGDALWLREVALSKKEGEEGEYFDDGDQNGDYDRERQTNTVKEEYGVQNFGNPRKKRRTDPNLVRDPKEDDQELKTNFHENTSIFNENPHPLMMPSKPNHYLLDRIGRKGPVKKEDLLDKKDFDQKQDQDPQEPQDTPITKADKRELDLTRQLEQNLKIFNSNVIFEHPELGLNNDGPKRLYTDLEKEALEKAMDENGNIKELKQDYYGTIFRKMMMFKNGQNTDIRSSVIDRIFELGLRVFFEIFPRPMTHKINFNQHVRHTQLIRPTSKIHIFLNNLRRHLLPLALQNDESFSNNFFMRQ